MARLSFYLLLACLSLPFNSSFFHTVYAGYQDGKIVDIPEYDPIEVNGLENQFPEYAWQAIREVQNKNAEDSQEFISFVSGLKRKGKLPETWDDWNQAHSLGLY